MTTTVGEYFDEIVNSFLTHKQASAACVASGAALLAILWWRRANRDLPPGPNLLSFGKMFLPKTEDDVRKNCIGLREKFGHVVCSRLFSMVFVILNSYEAIKEAYVEHGDSVSGRPHIKVGSRLDDEASPGLINADGLIWQEHRRFVLSSLRDFGFGKKTTEAMIQEEAQHLCKFFEEEGEGGKKSVDSSLAISKASTNVICSLVFGQRCGTEKEFEEVVSMLRQNRERNVSIVLVFVMRLIKLIPGDMFKMKRMFDDIDKMFSYVDGKIKAHRERHTEGNDGDVIDAYLTAQAQHERENPGKHTFTDFQLSRIIFELFLAGTDTTSTLLRWFLYTIAIHPEVQDKVQQELDEVIGQRMPSASDRTKLKYTDAVVHELQRYVAMLPLGGPLHRVTNEVHVCGYRLPKNAYVFANLYAVFRDPKLWPYPDELNVRNFYDEETKSLKNTEYLIPFMIGRRACPGESLAKQELFLFFASLMQRFKFTVDVDGSRSLKNDAINTFFRQPPAYKVFAASRF